MPVVYVAYVVGLFMPIVVKCNIDRFRMANLGHRPVGDGLANPRKGVDNAMMIYLISYVTSNVTGSPFKEIKILISYIYCRSIEFANIIMNFIRSICLIRTSTGCYCPNNCIRNIPAVDEKNYAHI